MDSEILFNEWKMKALETGGNRFSFSTSSELIEGLIESFKSNSIDLDDAKRYKKKVIEVLTTEEGRKGKGKYKNWVESIETRYLGTLAEFYANKTQSGQLSTGNCKLIEAWVNEKYKSLNNSSLLKEASIPTSIIHRDFLREVFDSTWFKEQKEYPIWVQKLLK